MNGIDIAFADLSDFLRRAGRIIIIFQVGQDHIDIRSYETHFVISDHIPVRVGHSVSLQGIHISDAAG